MEIMVGKIRDLQDGFLSSNKNILALRVPGGEKGMDKSERIRFFVLHFCFLDYHVFKTTSIEANATRLSYLVFLLLEVC